MSTTPVSPLPGWLDAPARWPALDPVADRIKRLVDGLPLGRARGLLRGAWLGHSLHPALVQLPLGCWLSASVLDLTGSSPTAARRLTALGLAGVPPALWAGWLDWAELDREQRRTGLVHAASAVTATVLQLRSLHARRRGDRLAGIGYGLAGNGVVALVGALGGHLAHRSTDAYPAADRRPAPTGSPAGSPVGESRPSETPEARMTAEGAPPPAHEELKTDRDGPEFAVTDPGHHRPGPNHRHGHGV
ncbi:(2Fe-2S)-binding protein [Kitasatospora sp. NPDC051853]|uniref:(2Fe-2S)-binding protein n=1 Tax=Kitasatospora sp. NPDC051853 TaxID=3364058 RepID=UPI0037BA7F83